MKRTLIVILLLSFLVIGFSLSDEEKAKLSFDKAFKFWLNGEPAKAYEILKQALYKPIDVRDISKFWYLKARVEVDLGDIEAALKDLKNVLIVDPTSVEVVSYLKELEYLLGMRKVRKDYRYKELFEIQGVVNSVEYFYTIDDVSIWGDELFAVDRVNRRLLIYKGNILVKSEPLSFQPLSLEISPWGVPYISATSGDIYVLGEKTSKVATGLKSAILAGFDRSGALWGVSGFNVFSIQGDKLSCFRLNESVVAIDCEVVKDGIWILDTLHRRLALYSFKTGKIEEDVPLYMDIRAFEVTPLGDFILLSNDGKLFVLRDKTKLVNLEISAPYAIGFEYRFPVLVFTDWYSHKIYTYLFTDGTPLVVKIDKMNYEETESILHLTFRVETLFGDTLPFVDMFTYPVVGGNRVFFNVEFSPKEVLKYKSGIDFLSDRLSMIKRGKGYDVVVPSDTYSKREDIIALRDKAVKLYIENFPRDEALKWLCEMSGGGVGENGPERSLRDFWRVSIPFTPGLLIKITPISIYSVMFDEIFSDTVYFVERGTFGEGE